MFEKIKKIFSCIDYENLIKKEFKFLKKLGFKVKNCTVNFEYEMYFIKDKIEIAINYVSYNNQVVGCGIKIGDKDENLLKNTIFDKKETDILNQRIFQNIQQAEEQIKIYAQFILQNINTIL